MIELQFTTGLEWAETVLTDLPTFLNDHAAAEKKASGMAVSMLSHYPDRPALVTAMMDLAIEEMTHFREVVKIMLARNIPLGPDTKDPYVNQFRQHIRRQPREYMLDRLLTAGIIEARGHERFSLLAEALTDPTLQRFYTAISRSESRHADLFVELAANYFPRDEINQRLQQLLAAEAAIVSQLPVRAALH